MNRDFVKLAYALGYRGGLEKMADEGILPRFSSWLARNVGTPIGNAGARFSEAGGAAMQQKFRGLGPAQPTAPAGDAHTRTAPGAYMTQPRPGKPGVLSVDRSGYVSRMSPADIGMNLANVRIPQPAQLPARSPNPAPQTGPLRTSARYDSSQAQALQQQQYGKDILRGMMQFNQNGDPQFKASQGMRDVAQRYKTDSNYAQMLRNAHKSMYGKDDAYTAWYDNWKAQRQKQPAPASAQPAQQPKLTPMTAIPKAQPRQPVADPRRFVVDYRDRSENQGGVFRRMLPSVRRRVANPRMVEVGNDKAGDAVAW